MNKEFLQATLIKEAGDIFTFVASDETLDRVGEVIPIDSWDLKNYKKNPVLLVNHDYKVENIVGTAKALRIEDGKMLFDAAFHGITQLSRDVREMVAQKVLNTVSVGFMRHSPQKDGDTEHNELFEISFVPVPANPAATRLKSLIEAGINTEEKSAIADWLETQKKEVSEKPEEKEVKEGRVLSGKNRGLVEDAIITLKKAVGALDDLLLASEPRSAGNDSEKGRDPKVAQTSQTRMLVRALQAIVSESNETLRKNKLTK